jgi:sarcosine oxidase
MTRPQYDIIVLGVGCMGAAACMTLAARGVRVLGLEQFSIPNGQGSSGGESRIFRIGYYEHPDYVPLLVRARWLWKRIEDDAERLVFLPCGGLWMGPRESELIAGTLRAARKHALTHEVLSVDEVAKRWPQFDPSLQRGGRAARPHGNDDLAGFYEQDAGMLLPENAIEAMVHLARRKGAEIRQGVRVRSWRMDGPSIVVVTDREEFRAQRLIITAGAWTAKVLNATTEAQRHREKRLSDQTGEVSSRLRVTRQALAWYDAKAAMEFSPRRMPCWARVRDDGGSGFFYGFPLTPGARAVKAALHEVAREADPDSIDRAVNDADVALLDSFLPKLFRGEVGPRFRASICMYTNSPDGHFIIDHLPGTDGRVTIACGFSGHGFKFAPVVGEALADLSMKGRTALPIGFLSLRRFSPVAQVSPSA